MKLLKIIFRLFFFFGVIYAGFKLFNKMNDGQLKMDLNIEDEKEVKLNVAEKIKLSPRQLRVYELIKKLRNVEMSDINKAIRGVTTRTLRRDLNALTEQGLVKKEGKTKSAKYYIVK